MGAIDFGTDVYVPALRDWVAKGAESEFVWSASEVREHLPAAALDSHKADPTFKLGVYFHEQGNEEKANQYWEEAQKLAPGNWNFHRQDWSFTPKQANINWYKKVQGLGDTPYYAPLELPGETEPTI